MADVSDYTKRITSEHADKPKYMALVRGIAKCFVDLQNALYAYTDDFDLDLAVGVQLDAVGEWVGINRYVVTPITGVYFSFDTLNVGFNEGIWQGKYDPSDGLVELDDSTYRLLIRAKIAANQWDGTIESAASILSGIFGSDTYVFIVDNQDMTMTVGLSGKLPSALFLAIFGGGYIPLRPSGVLVNYITTSSDGAPVFGFDVENNYIAGFDAGSWAVEA